MCLWVQYKAKFLKILLGLYVKLWQNSTITIKNCYRDLVINWRFMHKRSLLKGVVKLGWSWVSWINRFYNRQVVQDRGRFLIFVISIFYSGFFKSGDLNNHLLKFFLQRFFLSWPYHLCQFFFSAALNSRLLMWLCFNWILSVIGLINQLG